jgi:hypothetical protein
LFSEISKNWAAEPLDSYEKMLKFIRTTGTQTGLVVTAFSTETSIQPVSSQTRSCSLHCASLQAEYSPAGTIRSNRTCEVILAQSLSDLTVDVDQKGHLGAVKVKVFCK